MGPGVMAIRPLHGPKKLRLVLVTAHLEAPKTFKLLLTGLTRPLT